MLMRETQLPTCDLAIGRLIYWYWAWAIFATLRSVAARDTSQEADQAKQPPFDALSCSQYNWPGNSALCMNGSAGREWMAVQRVSATIQRLHEARASAREL